MTFNTDRKGVAITGLGMISSLGPDVDTGCAAARAGLNRAEVLSVLNFTGDQFWGNEPVVGHQVSFLTEGFTGIGKLFRLGVPALKDLAARTNILDEKRSGRTAIYVNFSDRSLDDGSADGEQETGEKEVSVQPMFADPGPTRDEQLSAFVRRLSAHIGLSVLPELHVALAGGHAGFISLVADAVERLESGEITRCIIGGIDSCIDPVSLEARARSGEVKTAVNPAGYIVGEAAAFILVERLDEARRRGADVGGLLLNPALASDPVDARSSDVSIGKALSEAIKFTSLPQNTAATAPGLVIGDLNGLAWRASEWGHAITRLAEPAWVADASLWMPAVSFGEIGAATGPVSICMGVRAFQRGYARTDRILIWLSSANGRKGALQLVDHSSSK